MSCVCLMVDGLSPDVSAQCVGQFVASETTICFDQIAKVALGSTLNTPNVWILPMDSFEDQQKCLRILHSRKGPWMWAEQTEVRLSLISLSCIRPPVHWFAVAHKDFLEDCPDYCVDRLFNDQETRHPGDHAHDDSWYSSTSVPQQQMLPDDNADVAEESQVDTYDFLNSVKWTNVHVTGTQATLILHQQTRDYITNKFRAQGVKATVRSQRTAASETSTENAPGVTVVALSDDDLIQAGVIVCTSVEDHVIELNSKSAHVLQLYTWFSLCNSLADRHRGKLLISAPHAVMTATDDIVEDVADEINTFIGENSLRSAVICLSQNRYSFFTSFCTEQIQTLVKQLGVYRVQIDVFWKTQLCQMLVTGTREGLAFAEEELREMESRILCHTLIEGDRVRLKFLYQTDPEYSTDLRNLSMETRCIFSQQEEESSMWVADLEDYLNSISLQQCESTTATRIMGMRVSPESAYPLTQTNPIPGEMWQLYLYTENKDRAESCQEFQLKLDRAVERRRIYQTVLDGTFCHLNEEEMRTINVIERTTDVKIAVDVFRGRLLVSGLQADLKQALEEIPRVICAATARLYQEQLEMEHEMTRPPAFWAPHRPTEHVKLVRLTPSDLEYTDVEERFKSTVSGTFRVKSIDRVQNPTLWRQYVAKRVYLEKQNTWPGVKNERTLWHGTPHANIHNINLNGFNRGYCGRNGTAYGEGVYFAIKAGYSTNTTYSPPDAQGLRYMYQCKVLVGISTAGGKHIKVPPARYGPVLYDSLVDNIRNPSVYVVFNDTQAYPEYLLTFE